jgi:hypothetical protein
MTAQVGNNGSYSSQVLAQRPPIVAVERGGVKENDGQALLGVAKG